jgi:hypothetical protein
MKRRHFIQFAGSTLTTLGISQTSFFHQADRYGQAIATSTPRKLALLIGINDYKDGINPLRGCVTDVEMQYELLVHRYGFQPTDIMIVADRLPRSAKQATLILPSRKNILDAIECHLIKQAKPGDVVVIHYSGHGALVGENSTIVPNDRIIPNTQTVDDISNDTLTLLRQRINTNNITLILDSCYSGGAIRGSAETVRSLLNRPSLSGRSATLSRNETDLRSRLLKETKTTLDEIRENPKGILIGAVGAGQLALDCVYGDENKFHAGAFSYLLTRYLWQASGRTPAATIVNESIAISIKAEVNELAPVVAGRDRQRPMYFQPPSVPSADAVIQTVTNDEITYWLGGESPLQLQSSRPNSIWSVFDQNGQVIGEIKQTKRDGLRASGTVRSAMRQPLQPGMLLRKRIRLIPSDFKLNVGRHHSWGNAESLTPPQRAILKAIEQANIVHWVDRDDQADCLLGRMTPELMQQSIDPSDQAIKLDSFGLLTPTHRPLWRVFAQDAASQDAAPESITKRLQSLVAIKYLKTTLGLQSLWEPNQPEFNHLNSGKKKLTSAIVPHQQDNMWETPQKFETGTFTQINFRNETSNTPLYIIVLTISTDAKLLLLYPQNKADINTPLPPGDGKIKIDRSPKPEGYQLTGVGTVETLVIASKSPLEGLFEAFKDISDKVRGEKSPPGVTPPVVTSLEGDDGIKVMTQFLNGLDQATRSGSRTAKVTSPDDDTDKMIDRSILTVTSHRIKIDPKST